MRSLKPIIAEVAAGARTDEREAALRQLLAQCRLLCIDGVSGSRWRGVYLPASVKPV